MKTNAARLLDNLQVTYSLREYEVDIDDLSAQAVATKIGFPIEQVFKTLVVQGNKTGVCLAVVPGDMQVDLKALAKISGNSDAKLAALKDVESLTGYIRGGVTALACKKPYPVFAHETIELFDEISISAGQRGTQIIISPQDYLSAVKATVGDIAKDE
ncbi:MAG: Cys-tRNA(Pro) deacylase [Candidatus Obscuribacterales bacterium]|nr:Cys-tRNA(Pro) deacylase [Candidatus Obscuribacterales bacterium]